MKRVILHSPTYGYLTKEGDITNDINIAHVYDDVGVAMSNALLINTQIKQSGETEKSYFKVILYDNTELNS